jgi:ATP-dependent 26S proteasome regulatory subunit
MNGASDPEREQALEDYKKSLLELREWEAKLKSLRLGIKDLQREFDISEENIKALQSVGQIIGEVLKQLDEERCTSILPLIFLCPSHTSELNFSIEPLPRVSSRRSETC